MSQSLSFLEYLKRVILSIELFSRLVIGLPLRRYQLGPTEAVVDSIMHDKGLEFLWVFPRQAGKDEAVAQLSVFLLVLFQLQLVEATIIHTYPTKPQISIGVDRLENRLRNFITGAHWWQKPTPTRRGVGRAQVTFFSGHPQSKAEGATANILLIVNEVQDHDATTIERRFTPMRSSVNATALYVGTVRTTDNYLWRKKGELERLQAADGVRRVFIISPEMVGLENERYSVFVDQQVAKYGRQHPIVRTEYFNEPVDVADGLFPPRRRALTRGRHPRQRMAQRGEVYVGLIDVGGQDEAATSAFAELESPARDYTCLTIVRVLTGASEAGPVYEVVDVFTDLGSRHFQTHPGRPSLFDRLSAYLESWCVAAVVCDSTGVGQGLTDALTVRLEQPVFGFDFAKSYGKSRLGNDFLAVVETGRFRYFDEDPDRELSDLWWFLTQCEYCAFELSDGVPIERGLRWGVAPSVRVLVESTGEAMLVHDDRLLSAALIAEVDRLLREGKLFLVAGGSYKEYLENRAIDEAS